LPGRDIFPPYPSVPGTGHLLVGIAVDPKLFFWICTRVQWFCQNFWKLLCFM
jgi:hypothetical protein